MMLTLTVIDASRIARSREVHGPDYAPSTQNFDGRVVMEVGGGKKHGRYWMGDSTPRDLAKGAERKRHNPPTYDTGAAADIVSTERTERESLQANFTQMYAWMQSMGTQVSVPPPQLQFQPPPRQPTPGLSAGSNDPAGMVTCRLVCRLRLVCRTGRLGELSRTDRAHRIATSPTPPKHTTPLAKALGKAPVQRPRACHPVWAPWVLCREPGTWLSANLEFFAESLALLCREPGTWLSANPAAGPTETAQRRLAGVRARLFAERLHALGKYLRCTRQRLCRDPGRKLSAKVASPRKTLPSQLCREPALGKAFAERMILFAESARLTTKSLDPVESEVVPPFSF
ncbi:hypothetical protein HU200_035888 [Digitaria exilis]|uniref:Uncharacterized protein n=1 Tax=Digitaria exilis TaxID=1010633 RepID=A0A835EKL1_9POAL|nr:hypothetical protein HU200_035888 [Digitaria exilis]